MLWRINKKELGGKHPKIQEELNLQEKSLSELSERPLPF